MKVKIQQISPDDLSLYASVSIAYEVRSVYRIEAIDDGLGGLALKEERVSPYLKDYDAQTDGDDIFFADAAGTVHSNLH